MDLGEGAAKPKREILPVVELMLAKIKAIDLLSVTTDESCRCLCPRELLVGGRPLGRAQPRHGRHRVLRIFLGKCSKLAKWTPPSKPRIHLRRRERKMRGSASSTRT